MKIPDSVVSYDDLIEFMYTPLPYEQNLVYVIDSDGRDHIVSSVSEINTFDSKTVKIEGMERYSENLWNLVNTIKAHYGHAGPVTCHAFLAEPNSPSFPEHTDPDDVVILCCSGTKTLEVNSKTVTLKRGETILIPRNTPHRAINSDRSLILSVGMERFFSDKLCEDY